MTEKSIKALSFEDALKELEGIVRQLEQGEVPLEQSIALYERGDQLRKHCEAKLREAELKVEKIVADAEGQAAGTEPMEGGKA